MGSSSRPTHIATHVLPPGVPRFARCSRRSIRLSGSSPLYGPPVGLVLLPWLFLGLMLVPPFACLFALVVVMVVAATVLAGLIAAVLGSWPRLTCSSAASAGTGNGTRPSRPAPGSLLRSNRRGSRHERARPPEAGWGGYAGRSCRRGIRGRRRVVPRGAPAAVRHRLSSARERKRSGRRGAGSLDPLAGHRPEPGARCHRILATTTTRLAINVVSPLAPAARPPSAREPPRLGRHRRRSLARRRAERSARGRSAHAPTEALSGRTSRLRASGSVRLPVPAYRADPRAERGERPATRRRVPAAVSAATIAGAVGATEHQRLLDAFVAAAQTGNLARLEQLLAAGSVSSRLPEVPFRVAA